MKLEHIALSITDPGEIEQFYYNILGMNELKSFLLDKFLARDIFGIEEAINVVHLQKDNLILEIFVVKEQCDQRFSHICVSTSHRKEIVQSAMKQSYKCIRITRPHADLIFISDRSGNLFELKQKN